MLPRDSQRRKVYRAEDSALVPLRRNLSGVDEAYEVAHRVMLRKGIRDRYGYAVNSMSWPVEIIKGTRGGSWGGRERILLGTYAGFTDHIVLHELAHTIHARITSLAKQRTRHKGTRITELAGGAAHGWQFCQVFLDLVLFGMGRAAHDALKASFKAGRVRIHKPRVMSPAQLEALAANRPVRFTKTLPPVVLVFDDQDEWPVPNEWTW